MEPFCRFAVFGLARDSAFVALAAFTLMVAFSFAPALAFGIGANIALFYAVALILRARRLTPLGIRQSEPWQLLKAEPAQAREPDADLATDFCKDLLLRYAKSATTAAIVLSTASLVLQEGATELAAEPAQHAAVIMRAR